MNCLICFKHLISPSSSPIFILVALGVYGLCSISFRSTTLYFLSVLTLNNQKSSRPSTQTLKFLLLFFQEALSFLEKASLSVTILTELELKLSQDYQKTNLRYRLYQKIRYFVLELSRYARWSMPTFNQCRMELLLSTISKVDCRSLYSSLRTIFTGGYKLLKVSNTNDNEHVVIYFRNR